MAGFEVIVRPVVFPNIRPAPTQPIAPADDPEQGFATLSGAGGGLVDLSLSEQVSWSRSKTKETKRRYDVARIYQMTGSVGGIGGESRAAGASRAVEIDRDVYVDVEVLNKVWMVDGLGVQHVRRYANIQPADNIEILQRDVTRNNT